MFSISQSMGIKIDRLSSFKASKLVYIKNFKIEIDDEDEDKDDRHLIFSVDGSQGFRLIDYEWNLEDLMDQNPDYLHRKFLKVHSTGNLVFYRRVSMFVQLFKENQCSQVVVFKLVPDKGSFKIQIIKHSTFNRNLVFNPSSVNSDLTTVTLFQQFKIKFGKHEFLLIKLVSADLKNIEDPDFQFKEDLIFLPETEYQHVTFDDDRRIYFDNLSNNYYYDAECLILRIDDLVIPRLPLGLENALLDFLSLKSDLQNTEVPIQLLEFELTVNGQNSFKLSEKKMR